MERLLEACRKGERKAQKELYQRMSPVLMGICKRYLKRKEDAEEALGNAFLKIYSSLSKYNGSGSFEGWMKKVTVRTCLDFLRAKSSPFDLDWEHEISEEPVGLDDAEYLLRLGFEILLISLIAGASLMYLREILKESFPSNEIFSQAAK